MTPRRSALVVLGAYLGARLCDLLVFVIVSRRDGLNVWDVLPSWDGGWYQKALSAGWPSSLPIVDGEPGQSTWAWPPAFPLLGRLIAWPLGPDSEAAALIGINVAAGAAAALVLWAAVRRPLGDRQAVLVAVAWAAMPAAPVLLMAYAEGLFSLLVFASIWAVVRQRLLLAGVLLVGAGLTKTSVLPFAVALALVAVLGLRRSGAPRVRPATAVGAVLLAAAAALAWPAIVAASLGSATAYGDVQSAWGRSTIPGRDTLASVYGLLIDPRIDILTGLLMTALAVVAGFVVWRDARYPLYVRIVGLTSPAFLLATGAALSSARLLLPDPALPGLAARLMRATVGIGVVLVVLTLMRAAWIALYVSGVSGDPPP